MIIVRRNEQTVTDRVHWQVLWQRRMHAGRQAAQTHRAAEHWLLQLAPGADGDDDDQQMSCDQHQQPANDQAMPHAVPLRSGTCPEDLADCETTQRAAADADLPRRQQARRALCVVSVLPRCHQRTLSIDQQTLELASLPSTCSDWPLQASMQPNGTAQKCYFLT